MEWWNYFTGSHLHDHETDYDMWISIWIRRKPLFDPKNNPLPRVQIYSGHPSSNISKHHDQQKVGKLGFIQNVVSVSRGVVILARTLMFWLLTFLVVSGRKIANPVWPPPMAGSSSLPHVLAHVLFLQSMISHDDSGWKYFGYFDEQSIVWHNELHCRLCHLQGPEGQRLKVNHAPPRVKPLLMQIKIKTNTSQYKPIQIQIQIKTATPIPE